MNGLFTAPEHFAPESERFVVAFGLGAYVTVVDRFPATVQALVYDPVYKLRTFQSEIPNGADDSMAFMWSLELVINLGTEGEVVLIREGSIGIEQLRAGVEALKALERARYIEPPKSVH